MSHVDKGALHAYLDGALDEYPTAEAEWIRGHVDQCVECAIRLEAERRIRMDAHSILSLATPEVEMPSLEELRAYVKRTRETRPASTTRMVRMGWAASVLLAVGAGWALRGGQLVDAPLVTAAVESPGGDALAPVRTNEGEGVTLSEESVTDAAGEPGVAGSTLAAAGEAGVTESTLAAAPGSDDRGLPERNDLPSAVVADARASTPPAEATPVLPPTPVDAGKIRLSSEDGDVALSTFGDVAPAAASVPPAGLEERLGAPPGPFDDLARETGDTEAPSATAEDADLVAEAEPEERRQAESLAPVTSALAESTMSMMGGQEQGGEDESTASEEAALMARGYDFVSMMSMGEGTTPVGMHVVQRYTPDTTFEIFHLESGVEMGVLPPLPSGHAMVRTRTVRGWIVVRGPLSQTELREIMNGLFPEPGRE